MVGLLIYHIILGIYDRIVVMLSFLMFYLVLCVYSLVFYCLVYLFKSQFKLMLGLIMACLSQVCYLITIGSTRFISSFSKRRIKTIHLRQLWGWYLVQTHEKVWYMIKVMTYIKQVTEGKQEVNMVIQILYHIFQVIIGSSINRWKQLTVWKIKFYYTYNIMDFSKNKLILGICMIKIRYTFAIIW